jgi:C-terminal processing protease CtpA/Prc
MRNPLKNWTLLGGVTAMVLSVLFVSTFFGAAAANEEEKVLKVAVKKTGWLGITMQNLSSHMAEALDLESDEGVLVDSVIDDSPAEAAGLEEGDVIIEFDGKEIEDTKDLSRAVKKTKPKEEVEITILRDGKERTLVAEIGEKASPDKTLYFYDKDHDRLGHLRHLPESKDIQIHRFGFGDHGYLGVQLQDLSEQLGDFFGVDEGEGALISEVLEDSPAEEAGLKAGDVIVRLDDEEVTSAREVQEYLADTDEGDEVELEVIRDRKKETFNATLGEVPDELAWVGEKDIRIAIPKMHAIPWGDKRLHREDFEHDFEWFDREDFDDEMEDLKEALEELRKELKELKKDLK